MPQRRASLARPNGRILHPWCPEFCGYERTSFSLASSTWFSANDPLAVGFVLREAATIQRLGTINGSAAGDNWDVGVYDLSWNRLISTGSTTGVGNSAAQYVDVTDTPLMPGRYWAVMARDTITANRQMFASTGTTTIPPLEMCGIFDSATDAFPLPNPLTNMALVTVATRIPIFLIDLA